MFSWLLTRKNSSNLSWWENLNNLTADSSTQITERERDKLAWRRDRQNQEFKILDCQNPESQGAYQKSELASRICHFENEIGFFRDFSLKTHHCYA